MTVGRILAARSLSKSKIKGRWSRGLKDAREQRTRGPKDQRREGLKDQREDQEVLILLLF